MRNISQALTVIAFAECREHFMHADVVAFGAPSECHDLVSRGEAERLRLMRRRVHSLTGLPYRVFCRKVARDHGLPIGGPKWQSIVGRVYARNYPY
jgi:hypothetical protein